MGIYDQHTPEVGSGKYFKPEDGKTYNLKIVGEPVIFDNVFDQPGKPIAISTKYAWKVWNYTDKLAQILQLPGTGYKALAAIATNPKWGDPEDGKYDIDYKRTGTGTDTVHSLVPVPAEGVLTEEQQAEIDRIDLVKDVAAGKGAQRVQLLSEVVESGKRTPKQQDDVVIEDVGDDPINLDDIPF